MFQNSIFLTSTVHFTCNMGKISNEWSENERADIVTVFLMVKVNVHYFEAYGIYTTHNHKEH